MYAAARKRAAASRIFEALPEPSIPEGIKNERQPGTCPTGLPDCRDPDPYRAKIAELHRCHIPHPDWPDRVVRYRAVHELSWTTKKRHFSVAFLQGQTHLPLEFHVAVDGLAKFFCLSE